jgi:hypothetical protein
MSVSVVLSCRGLCDGPIPSPEESYRLWCVIVCDLETLRLTRPWPALGCCARERESQKKQSKHKELLSTSQLHEFNQSSGLQPFIQNKDFDW